MQGLAWVFARKAEQQVDMHPKRSLAPVLAVPGNISFFSSKYFFSSNPLLFLFDHISALSPQVNVFLEVVSFLKVYIFTIYLPSF